MIIWKTFKIRKPVFHLKDYNGSMVYLSTFKYADLKVTLLDDSKRCKDLAHKNLTFGKSFSEHMFSVQWSAENGWEIPQINPYSNLIVQPSIKALHYAIQLFDGLKAHRGFDDKIRLFRPELNIERMLTGTRRLCLPEYDSNEFLKCIKALVEIDQIWVPKSDINSLNSLYIRPTLLGTEPTLGVASSLNAHLFVITSPVGSYFPSNMTSIKLYVDPDYVRAWPGGVGDIKLGSNYAPTVFLQKKALDNGCHQVLWVYGPEHEITEVGTMNIFMLWENHDGKLELITAPLNGLILPGVTRRSILELSRKWGEFLVSEKTYTMSDFITGIKENRVKEFFGSGTACVITPVSSILFNDTKYDIPTMSQPDPIYQRLTKELTGIYVESLVLGHAKFDEHGKHSPHIPLNGFQKTLSSKLGDQNYFPPSLARYPFFAPEPIISYFGAIL